jgi:polyisoprenoid-binding protein YceI
MSPLISRCALLGAATVLFTVPVAAQQKLIVEKSTISFTSKQMGVPVDGNFKRFDAQVLFDPKKPDASKVSFNVDLTSVNIGNAETETELRKPGWFDSTKVPTATFVSTGVKSLPAGKFEFAGKLTIKGQAQNVVVPVTLTQKDGVTQAAGSFVIKRLDFKIGDGDWNDPSLVANEVTVAVKLALSGVSPL